MPSLRAHQLVRGYYVLYFNMIYILMSAVDSDFALTLTHFCSCA